MAAEISWTEVPAREEPSTIGVDCWNMINWKSGWRHSLRDMLMFFHHAFLNLTNLCGFS